MREKCVVLVDKAYVSVADVYVVDRGVFYVNFTISVIVKSSYGLK